LTSCRNCGFPPALLDNYAIAGGSFMVRRA
jgi:hypothetical protein